MHVRRVELPDRPRQDPIVRGHRNAQATRLGIDATIVMPAGTPFVKVRRTQVLGARVVEYGEDLGEAGIDVVAFSSDCQRRSVNAPSPVTPPRARSVSTSRNSSPPALATVRVMSTPAAGPM